MKPILKIMSLAIILAISPLFTYAQDNEERALELTKKAIKLEDAGNIDDAIELLKKAVALSPGDVTHPYELAYAYYMKKEYKTTIKTLEKIIKHKDATDRFYQLLGNSYDNVGKASKAIKTYQAGLKKFPKSGNLYLEMGIMQMGSVSV